MSLRGQTDKPIEDALWITLELARRCFVPSLAQTESLALAIPWGSTSPKDMIAPFTMEPVRLEKIKILLRTRSAVRWMTDTTLRAQVCHFAFLYQLTLQAKQVTS